MTKALESISKLVSESLGIDLGTILIQLIGILIMFLIVKKYLWTPITNNIEKRREYVKKQIEDAEESNKKAASYKDKYEQRLKDAKIERRDIISQARKDAKLEGERIIEKSKADAVLETKKAQDAISREKEVAKQELQKETLDIAFSIAQKIVEKEVSKEDNKDVVDNFLKEVDKHAS